MRYEVAIPSYRRADRIGTLTIPLLLAGGVDPARITVWVADRADLVAYAPVQNLGVRLLSHEHGKGVMYARNAIATSYPPGTRLMCFDDDIRAFVRAVDSKTLVPLEDIHGMIERGFAVADGKLWCVAPVPNPHRVAGGHGYIVVTNDIVTAVMCKINGVYMRGILRRVFQVHKHIVPNNVPV